MAGKRMTRVAATPEAMAEIKRGVDWARVRAMTEGASHQSDGIRTTRGRSGTSCRGAVLSAS